MWINLDDATFASLRDAVKGTPAGERLEAALPEVRPDDGAYRLAAQSLYQQGGMLEFDDDAVVSLSEDGGAYVMGWRWVDDEDAGIGQDEAHTT